MKTGFRRRIPHRTAVVAALSALTLVLALTACDDHSPTTAPTSTLPAQRPGTSTDEAEPQIPEYETELDLSTEEKEAVEGALVAFHGFFSYINKAYTGESKVADNFPEVASGEALKSIENEASAIENNEAIFKGQINPLTVNIFRVESRGQDKSPNSVVVHFCVDTTRWTMTSAGNSPTINPDGFVTMEHRIQFDEGEWKVDQQSLWDRKC